jgi:hypothetical protein
LLPDPDLDPIPTDLLPGAGLEGFQLYLQTRKEVTVYYITGKEQDYLRGTMLEKLRVQYSGTTSINQAVKQTKPKTDGSVVSHPSVPN